MPRKTNPLVVTVQDIARETGLSASSVSAVLSGQHVKRRISTRTVERIQSAARSLRYVPNITARSLRAQASGTKHVVLSILTSYEAPVFLVTQALRAVERAVAQHGEAAANYTVNIEMFHAGQLARLPGLIDGHRCNGAIITNTVDLDDQFLASAKLPFPVVLLGRRIPGYAGVSVKLEMMGRQAAEILLAAGRRKLAVLQPSILTQATRSRFAAFVSTAEQIVGLPPMMITCENLQERAGYDGMRRFLGFNPDCDGRTARWWGWGTIPLPITSIRRSRVSSSRRRLRIRRPPGCCSTSSMACPRATWRWRSRSPLSSANRPDTPERDERSRNRRAVFCAATARRILRMRKQFSGKINSFGLL
jgi:DNA-binding LacI/PurR family transcriptional regulator